MRIVGGALTILNILGILIAYVFSIYNSRAFAETENQADGFAYVHGIFAITPAKKPDGCSLMLLGYGLVHHQVRRKKNVT